MDNYYKYGESINTNEKGVTIYVYESAWLADLVVSYLLDNSEDVFKSTSKHYGIYIYDSIIFVNGKWSNEDITRWIKTFKLRVDDLYDLKGLHFTAEIW